MATVQFGNASADMRLTEDSYGIPALQDFDDFLLNFVLVREVVLVDTPTQLVFRDFDSRSYPRNRGPITTVICA